METVSIIIPVYNVRPYIDQCLRSVLGQSYTDLEVILIDDGSTDGTGEVLDGYAKKDPRIHVEHCENKGTAAARNTGLELATGKYLTFVDSDDYISRTYIEKLHARMIETDADMVVCGLSFVDEEGKVLKRLIPERYEKGVHEEWLMRISAVCAHFYKRELWEAHHVRFAEGVRGEDMPISLYFAGVCEGIAILKEAGYAYVQHETSAMHNFRGLRNYDLPCGALLEAVKKAKEQGIQGSEEAFELFTMRILTTCLFDLARGAERKKKEEILQTAEVLLYKEMPGYWNNSLVWKGKDLDIPFMQKVAVRVLAVLAKIHLLRPVVYLL